MIERTKVLDTIYDKHGTKLNYLQHALEHYDLQNDKDVKDLEASFAMKIQNT